MDSFNLEARRFDLIAELAKCGAEHQISLHDPNTISAFLRCRITSVKPIY